MNALLVRVGADRSLAGGSWNGPIDSESREFAYVAIPENNPVHGDLEKPYSALAPKLARFGVSLPTHLRVQHMHLGAAGTQDYKSRFPIVKDAVEKLGRGHCVRHDEPLLRKFEELKEQVWRDAHERVVGWHTSAPRRGVCHRSRSCGVLTTYEDC